MTEICTFNTDEEDSTDIVLADGASITISLFGASTIPQGCTALIQQKQSNGAYLTKDAIYTEDPVRVLQANGTWRVRKLASSIACGVDGD